MFCQTSGNSLISVFGFPYFLLVRSIKPTDVSYEFDCDYRASEIVIYTREKVRPSSNKLRVKFQLTLSQACPQWCWSDSDFLHMSQGILREMTFNKNKGCENSQFKVSRIDMKNTQNVQNTHELRLWILRIQMKGIPYILKEHNECTKYIEVLIKWGFWLISFIKPM